MFGIPGLICHMALELNIFIYRKAKSKYNNKALSYAREVHNKCVDYCNAVIHHSFLQLILAMGLFNIVSLLT